MSGNSKPLKLPWVSDRHFLVILLSLMVASGKRLTVRVWLVGPAETLGSLLIVCRSGSIR